uniref:Uncharacterized protein n=1 Tax=Anguilla anguilla TaxID=7936 RepID=A0A0E9XYI1_ANGAN
MLVSGVYNGSLMLIVFHTFFINSAGCYLRTFRSGFSIKGEMLKHLGPELSPH